MSYTTVLDRPRRNECYGNISSSTINFDLGLLGALSDYGRFTVIKVEQENKLSDEALSAIYRIKNFKNLKENWDSYNAATISKTSIEAAEKFVRKTDKLELLPYFVSPGPNGEVMVEFKNDELAAEVYFNPDGLAEVIFFNGTDSVLEEAYTGDIQKIASFINGEIA